MSTSDLLAAFEANPSDHRAFEALIKQLVAEGDRETLQSVYERLPEWVEDGSRSPLLRVLSQQARTAEDEEMSTFLHYWNGIVLWRQFDDPRKAEMSFRKLKSPPPDPEPLREFYLDFYTKQQNWRRLEQFLTDPNKGGMEDAVQVKRMLGRLAEEHDQPERAINFWQGVRQADPDDREAEEALARLYQAVGKWHAMVELLKDKLKRLPDDDVEGRIDLHRRMIGIYKDQLNAPSKVVSAWQSILDIEPGNQEALDALASEYQGMKRWPDLVKVLQQKIEHEPDAERQIALHQRIASIMLDKFSNSSEAIKHYEAILELNPAHEEAIDVLKEIYEQRRDYDSFIHVSEREIALQDDPAAQHEAYLQLARLASERIRKPATPIQLWERVRQDEPDHMEALEHLESLYEREKNFELLTDVQERRVALLEDPKERAALLEKLGLVYTSRLDDADKAADVWKRLLELDPEHRKAQAELKKKFLAEKDWENLEWFFRSYGTLQEWVRTLESQAKQLDDPEVRTRLLFTAARVWQDELDDVRRAVKNLEKVLDLSPRHAEAARMLVPIYRELNAWKKLPPVYDIVLEATEPAEERREILLELARVHEERLRDVDAAFFNMVQAVRESPNAIALYPELRRLAEQSGNWETYVAVLEESVDLIEEEPARVGALLDAGQVYLDRLEDGEAALNAFQRVIALDDRNRAALDAIEDLYRKTGAWDQLVGIYDKKLRIARDADERKDILFLLASVWRDQLGSNEEAEALYREMLDDFPEDIRIHDALCAIYMDEGRHEPLRGVLERKRDVLAGAGTDGTVLADLECQIGMLTYGIDPSPEGVAAAVDRYEAALTQDPGHAEAVQAVEELLADEGQRLRIARILEPIYESRSDWRLLAEALELQLRAAEQDGDEITQIALLDRLSGLYTGPLEDRDLSWRTYGRQFRLQPEREDVRAAFEELTDEQDRWRQMIELYTELADDPADQDTRLAVKLAVARAWHGRLEDLEQARVFYHKVLDEAPEHQEALDALEGIYIALDRSEDLLDIFRRKVDLSSDVTQKLDYLFRTSDLLRDRLERYEDAVDAARDALALEPAHLGAMQRLDELFSRTEQWTELSMLLGDTLRQEDVAADDERRTLLTLRLAGIHEARLDDVERAITLYAEVLDIVPDELSAVAALERLFAEPEWAPRIAPILQPYYDRQGDWRRLIAVYEVREEDAPLVPEKVEWHYEIADLYEHRGELLQEAFDHYVKAARLDPGSERTLGELMRLAEALDDHATLVGHLEALVDDIDDDLRRKETHRTTAELQRDRTHDLEGAERHFRAILDIDPGDMAAIDDLIALYRQTDQTDKLVDTLLVKAPMVEDAEDQRALYAEAGDLSATVLGNAERAIEIYETLHNLDPTQDVALNALEQLYEQVEMWDRLVDVYRQKIDRAEDLDVRKHYAGLMGHVQADRQEILDDAVATWRTVLDWDAQDMRALDELDALYIRQEDWFSLREILLRKQELLDEEGWIEVQYRLARLFESDDRLADPLQAIQAYKELLARRPDHAESIRALEDIIANRDEREQAFEVLRPVLDRQGAHEELWQQFEVIARHQQDDPFRLIGTLHEMADLAEIALEDPRRAFEACARAFRADPRHQETIERLERLADEHDLLDDLVTLYSEGAAEADDDFLALELRLKTGALLMDRLGRPERAIEVYETIREDHPDHSEALERLHSLYESQGMARELAEVIRQQADIHLEPAEKIPFLAKLAQVREQQLGDAEAAYEAYMEILDLERGNDLAVRELWRLYVEGIHRLDIAFRLEPIYMEREAWDELHALLELKLEAVEDVTDRMEIMRQLAELNLDRLGRKPEAIIWYGRAFRLDPEDEFLLTRLDELSTEAERWEDYRAILMDAASVVEDEARKVELWHRAAAISRDMLDQPAEAERVYRMILDLDPENYRALQALDQLLALQERWEDLEPVLSQEAKVADFDDDRIALLVRLAELYRDRLDRREDAVGAYRQVLDLNDMHRPALEALEVLYRDGERWEPLYEALQTLADTARDDEERVRRLGEMAQIAEVHLDNVPRAVELWEEVLTLSPEALHAVHELERLLEGQRDWEGMVDAYERELRMGIEDAERRLDVYKRVGRTLQAELDDVFRAQSYWQNAREESPYDRETLEALRVAYRESFALEGLVDVLQAQIQSGHYDDDALLALWRELAELRTEQLPDPDQAVEAWRNVLQLAPGDAQAIENLERLYEQEQRWADAVELLGMRLGLTGERDEKLELWLRMGAIQHDKLEDPQAAAQTYGELLATYPDELEASRRLEAIHEAAEDWASLAEVLLERTDHLPDATDRLMNLQRLARVYEERLSQPEGAFLVLQRANEEVPDDIAVLDELGRLGAETGLWEELLGTYDHTLPHIEGDTRLEIMLKAAEVVRDRLNDPAEAVAYYARVLEQEEENETALRALVDLNAQLERWSALVHALENLAEVTPDFGERANLWKRVARVQEEQIGDADRAVAAWYEVLDVDEVDREALANLERLHEQRGEWDKLIEILEATSRVEPDRTVELNLRIGDILETRLERIDDAIERYEEVLTFEPGNAAALERLETLYGDREDWEKLVEVYERSHDTARDDAERVEVCRKIALVQRAVFEDADTAADWNQRILMLAPGDDEALTALEEIYREQSQWDDLVDVYEKRREAAETTEERADALMKMAAVHRDDMMDVDNAIRTYERVLEDKPDHREALDTLEGLYAEEALWKPVIDTIEKKLAVETDPEARLELMCRQGQIAWDEMANPDEAAHHYDRALSERPGYEPATVALIELYTREERFERVVDTLERKLTAIDDPHEQCRVHIELAQVHRERLHDPDKALQHLEAAVEADPDSEAALEPLADHYMSIEEWTKAMPLLDVLADRLAAHGDEARLGEVHKKLARCAESLLDDDRAIDEYERARAALPHDPEVLLGLGRLHFKRRSWEQAEATYRQLAEEAGEELEGERFVEVYIRLGEAALKAGHIDEAKRALGHVIEEQPGNAEAVRSISEVLEAHGDWDEAVAYKRRLVDLVDEPLEKFTVLMSIGDIHADPLQDPSGAAEAYEEALDHGAFSKAPLLQLIQLHARQKNYTEAIRWLNRIIEVEDDPKKKAHYAMSVAVMYRDELGDNDQAVDYFNQVLDHDLDKLEAFRAIDELVTELRDWKLLEQSYRRMIQRVQEAGSDFDKGPALLFTLYKNLGEIYRSRLKNLPYALSAFELASQQRPRDEVIREILAGLYEADEEQLDKAADQHRFLIQMHVDRWDSYHRLFRVYKRTGQGDRAWCVAGLLSGLDKADEEEEHFYRTYQSPTLPDPDRPLDQQAWMRWVMSPKESPVLGQAFALIYQTLGETSVTKTLKELGLKKKDRMDLSEQTLVASTMKTVSRLLGIPMPEVYKDERRMGFEILPTMPPTLAMGSDMLSGQTEKELAFRLAKRLTYFHPWRIMAAQYEHDQLDLIFMGAATLVDPSFQLPLRDDMPEETKQALMGQVADIREELEKSITPQTRKQLTQVITDYLSREKLPRIGQWHRQVELTANHAGLFVSGDVELVAQVLSKEVSGASKLSRGDKLKDLVIYVLSDRYAELRTKMGMEIDYTELLG
ncbi:MAG: tetratricopeptide repeat protein [Myxococcota bacterium]